MAFTIYSDINGLSWVDKSKLENIEVIYQMFYNLFNTSKGERVDLPEFGASPDSWVFELIDEVTALTIYQNVITETERWIPMAYIDIQNSEVNPNEDENGYEVNLAVGVKGLEDNQFSKFDFIGEFTA